MEGEQKRVFLVITQEEIDGIQPPKGIYFTKFLSAAEEIWVSEKLMKQKNRKKSAYSGVYLPDGGLRTNHPSKKGTDKGECI
mgnify:CR=1 FL=1